MKIDDGMKFNPSDSWLKESGTSVHVLYIPESNTPMIGIAIKGKPPVGKIVGEFTLYQNKVDITLYERQADLR